MSVESGLICTLSSTGGRVSNKPPDTPACLRWAGRRAQDGLFYGRRSTPKRKGRCHPCCRGIGCSLLVNAAPCNPRSCHASHAQPHALHPPLSPPSQHPNTLVEPSQQPWRSDASVGGSPALLCNNGSQTDSEPRPLVCHSPIHGHFPTDAKPASATCRKSSAPPYTNFQRLWRRPRSCSKPVRNLTPRSSPGMCHALAAWTLASCNPAPLRCGRWSSRTAHATHQTAISLLDCRGHHNVAPASPTFSPTLHWC